MKTSDQNLSPVEPEKGSGSASSMNPILKEILSWVEVIVVAVILAWFITSFIIVNATVPSGSMQNTIQPGDRLLGFRLTYLFTDPPRDDIVVFHCYLQFPREALSLPVLWRNRLERGLIRDNHGALESNGVSDVSAGAEASHVTLE